MLAHAASAQGISGEEATGDCMSENSDYDARSLGVALVEARWNS